MKEIYLDNAATAKPLHNELNEALATAERFFYNPSALYRGGRAAAQLISKAREDILAGLDGFKLVFTSCGTEADNTAIFSFFRRGNAVTTKGEHSAVQKCFEKLQAKGFDVRYAELNADGSVNEQSFLALVDEQTTFASVVHVNNETGAINDISRLCTLAKSIAPKIVFHSDGVQAFGKIPFPKTVDLYSVSAHKLGAIKGVGALIYNSKLHVEPYIFGGGQENGLRSGTENVLGIVDFSFCTKYARENLNDNLALAYERKKKFVAELELDKIKLISSENCSPYVVSVSAVGLRGEVLQHLLEDEGIIVGTGSACSSKHPHSRVIKACGYDAKVLDGILRFSFIFDTSIEDAVFVAKKLNECVKKLSEVMR